MITLDTNVFVYLADDGEPRKQAMAREIIAAAATVPCAVGLQVVGELQQAMRRKLKTPPWVAAQASRNVLTVFQTFAPDLNAAEEALSQLASGRLSYWDALLLASARTAGCTAVLTEDLQDGAVVMGLEIVNPFGGDGLSDRAQALLRPRSDAST